MSAHPVALSLAGPGKPLVLEPPTATVPVNIDEREKAFVEFLGRGLGKMVEIHRPLDPGSDPHAEQKQAHANDPDRPDRHGTVTIIGLPDDQHPAQAEHHRDDAAHERRSGHDACEETEQHDRGQEQDATKHVQVSLSRLPRLERARYLVGIPSVVYLLGQMIFGSRCRASAMICSIAGHGVLRHLPPALG
jgi:hypothetical protein